MTTLLLLLACTSPGDKGDTSADTDSATADSGAVDSGDTDSGDTDSGDTDSGDTDSGDTGEPPRDWATGIADLGSAAGAYAEDGYEVTTFEVQDDYAVAFITPDGNKPRFYVLWPVDDDPTTPRPVTMFLHGGSTDVDTAKDPDGGDDRCTLDSGATEANRILNGSPFARMQPQVGGILIAPANSFCDGWAGLGPDDPVDTMHGGERLAEAALGYLLYGQTRFAIDEDHVTLAGSSLGGIGSPWTLTRRPEIDALIVDSAIGDMSRYCWEESYSDYDFATRQERCLHVIGGPAWEDDAHTVQTEWWPRYVDHSLELLIEAGTVTTPVFQSYNDTDPLCPGAANRDLVDALGTFYDPIGVRHTSLDVDHADPPHGQLTNSSIYYLGWGALRFSLGQTVQYVEAEDDTGAGRVGTTYAAGMDDQWMSKAGGRQATVADGAGTLWSFDLPDIPAGTEGTVAVLLAAAEVVDPLRTAAVVRVEEAGVELARVEIHAADLAFTDAEDWTQRSAALSASTLSFTPTGAGPLTVSVDVSADATITADIAVIDW